MGEINSLSNLSSALYDIIKDDDKFDITKVPLEALGITYAPFLKRVKENRLLLGEIQKIANYCGFQVVIQIDQVRFENSKTEDPKAKYVTQKASQKDLYKIIKLTEEIGALKLENQHLTYENERLKQQLKK